MVNRGQDYLVRSSQFRSTIARNPDAEGKRYPMQFDLYDRARAIEISNKCPLRPHPNQAMTKKPTIAASPKALEATILLAELPASAEVDGRAAAAARLPEGAALPEGTADSFDITAEEAADGSALDSSVKRASELYEEHCDVAGISAV